MTTQAQKLLQKYQTIIAEEVNVKSVRLLDDDQQVKMQYVPLGNKLGADFGKDTGRIIWSAKQWKAKIQDDGSLLVEDGSDAWTLSSDQFEVRYSWFDQPNQIVEEWAMVELNLDLTDELVQEWIAREISRFINQMRKDADYTVSDRVACGYVSLSTLLSEIIQTHAEYLQAEALLSWVQEWESEWDHTAEFEYEWGVVTFTVKR